MAAHTTQSASRMRTRVASRTFPAHCNTCAHFCCLGPQCVSSFSSTLLIPCTRRAPPTALTAHLSQATPFPALGLSAGVPFGNIFVACNAHMVFSFPPQLVAHAGHAGAFRRCNIAHQPAMFQHNPWRPLREREQQRQQRRARDASWQRSSRRPKLPATRGCPPRADARLARMPASRGCRLTPMPAPCGCSP